MHKLDSSSHCLTGSSERQDSMKAVKPFRHGDSDFFLPELCRGEALLGLILLAQLLVMVLILADPGISGLDWTRLALASLFVQWAVLLTVALLCPLRSWLMQLGSLHASLLICLLVVLITLACTAAGQAIQKLHPGPLTHWPGEPGLYLKNALISLIMSAIIVRMLYLQSESRRRQQAELQARLQALQARIQPHFLFNSLNSVASLIPADADKAEQALLDLSDLFRAALGRNDGLSSWQQELELAQRYLSLEQLRLAGRLRLDWQTGQLPADLPIPHLCLQPLLENAILHGLQPLPQGGVIVVHAGLHQGLFRLRIENPLPDKPGLHHGSGTALENTRMRLAALFGPSASLSTHTKGGVFITQIQYSVCHDDQEIPVRHENTDRR